MSTATSDTPTLDAERYLREVAPHLAALPAEERADLLEDLAQHLREIAAEPGPPLAERLGSPGAYAAELLATAGVTVGATARPTLRDRLTPLRDRARRSWLGEELSGLAPALRPAWWVLRAYLAVSLLSALWRDGSYPGFPVPRLGGSAALGLLAVLAAVPLSVRLGRRSLPRAGRLAVAGAHVVLVLYAGSLLGRAGTPEVRYVHYGEGPPTAANRGCLANASGRPITNLYAYGPDGTLLDPVLLYDQNGQPIDNLCPEYDDRGRRLSTEYAQDVNGAPVINAFPRRQTAWVLPGVQGPGRPPMPTQPAATVPVMPPAVVVPRLAPTTTAAPAPTSTTVVSPPG